MREEVPSLIVPGTPGLRRTNAGIVVPVSSGLSPLPDLANLVRDWRSWNSLQWTTSARDTLVSADGDPVGSVEDGAGSGIYLAQATEAKRPTYKTNILNGHPVWRLDGTDDELFEPTDGIIRGVQPTTVYIVCKINAGGTLISAPNLRVHTTSSQFHVENTGGGDCKSSAGSADNAAFRIYAFTRSGSAGGATKIYINKVQNDDASAVSDWAHTDLWIGSYQGFALYVTGDIAAVIVYNGAHDATMVGDVSDVLNEAIAVY